MGYTINWTDNTPEGKKRREKILSLLPPEPIVSRFIDDDVLKRTRKKLVEVLKAEIEIYKAWPDKHRYEPDIFNPRNSRQCFMGQGFRNNGTGFEGWTDKELNEYRSAIGTIPHESWGECTLLEIWGADHFEKWPDMVRDVFHYCHNQLDKLPKITFYINPFYKNEKSGTWLPDEDEVWQSKNRLHISKIADYIEIRDLLKAKKLKNPMELHPDETVTEEELKQIIKQAKS